MRDDFVQKLSNDINDLADILLAYREQSKAAKLDAEAAAAERKKSAVVNTNGHRSTKTRIEQRRATVTKARHEASNVLHTQRGDFNPFESNADGTRSSLKKGRGGSTRRLNQEGRPKPKPHRMPSLNTRSTSSTFTVCVFWLGFFGRVSIV